MSDLAKAATELYEYGFALVVTEATHYGSDDKGITHFREFPTEKNKKVVRLNMDTLYSLAWTQLARTPYVVHIPKITERYYLFPIMDAYTNVVESIGTRTPERAEGDYLLILEGEDIPKGYENHRIIRLKNSLNAVLLRIETRGKADYGFVNSLQDKFVFKPLYEDRIKSSEHEAPESPVAFTAGLSAEEFFKLFAKLSKENPIADERYVKYFELFGYDRENGSFAFENLSEEQKEALEQGRINALDILRKGIRSDKYGVRKRGWLSITGGIGNYGDDYRQRALTAYGGWGANLIEDSAYVAGFGDDDGERFSNRHSYRLHFAPDGYPHAAVFWSITLYGEPSMYPAANSIDRFAINSFDLENGNVSKNEDGSLDIYISKDAPEGETARNWLPAPQNEEHFSLTIRIYYPDEITIRGQWDPPSITKI